MECKHLFRVTSRMTIIDRREITNQDMIKCTMTCVCCEKSFEIELNKENAWVIEI
jgi:hypothetical protein